MIIDNLEFDITKPWWCVMGGVQEIAKRMATSLQKENSIQFQKRVTKIVYNDGDRTTDTCIGVTVQAEDKPRTYHGVFNSATLGAQQHMNLTGLNLNYGTKQAIRSLGYGASCKVGIRFKRLWWREAPFNITRAGVAHTDRPIRACVYPSYNLYDDVAQPGVLLASYTWSQEAERIGALIDRRSPDGEAELRELLINDLTSLHANQNDPADYDRVHHLISDNYLSHYAYNWYSDPNMVGAFAYFGPGQFQNMWQWITRTDGNYMIIGEASSSHHAWVVGALESAVRAVYQFLYKHSAYSAKVDKILQAYAQPALLPDGKTENPEAVKFPFGPVPHEFDRTVEVKYPDGVKPEDASPLGELARHQVFIETVRQELVEKGIGGDQLDAKLVTKEQVDAFPFVTGSNKVT
jgi:monoamine oxidase